MMKLLTPELRRQLAADKIKVCCFLGYKKQGEPPFFISGVAPSHEKDYGAILDKSLSYATAEGDTPEEAVAALRDKLWSGL